MLRLAAEIFWITLWEGFLGIVRQDRYHPVNTD